MFSISKLMALAAIIAIIWYGFRLVGRLDQARKRKVAEERGGGYGRQQAPRGGGRDDVVDLVRDEKTGEYVTRDKRDDRA
jgi:hypothetical protein